MPKVHKATVICRPFCLVNLVWRVWGLWVQQRWSSWQVAMACPFGKDCHQRRTEDACWAWKHHPSELLCVEPSLSAKQQGYSWKRKIHIFLIQLKWKHAQSPGKIAYTEYSNIHYFCQRIKKEKINIKNTVVVIKLFMHIIHNGDMTSVIRFDYCLHKACRNWKFAPVGWASEYENPLAQRNYY